MENQELSEFLAENLVMLDKSYAARGVNLSIRVWHAATFVVDNLLIKISGDTKENYLEKAWFAVIYTIIEEWYVMRYGDAYRFDTQNDLLGTVQVHSRWFLLDIPASFIESRESDSFWVRLPTSIYASEAPLKWFSHGPNAEALSSGAKSRLIKRISVVTSNLRTIRLNLWAHMPSKVAENISAQIMKHFETATRYLSQNNEHSAQLAMWEICLAVEKCFKLLLLQKQGEYPEIHNLNKLNRLCVSSNIVVIDKRDLHRLPSEYEAMKYRYAETQAPTLRRQWQIYTIGLEIGNAITQRLNRKYQFYDSAFQFRNPPWQKKLA